MSLALLFPLVLAQAPVFAKDTESLPIPFERFTTRDQLGRTITAYLSRPPKNGGDAKVPLVLVIQGSGCQSLWVKHGDRVGGGLQNLVLQLCQGKARVLAVEKPGVAYLDWPKQPGSAMGASKEFLQEHTLPRWAEANAAALRAALTQPGIDPKRVLVLGHSEGGIVAARVAAQCPEVTHVAPLACGGTTQLHSLAVLAARRAPKGQENAAIDQLHQDWAKVLARPESIEEFWMGHPYRRWSSFLKDSVLEELKKTKAQIYLAHGVEDEADAIEGFDAMRAELLAAGRAFTAERIAGVGHGFNPNGKPNGGEGMSEVFGRVLSWFGVPPRKQP